MKIYSDYLKLSRAAAYLDTDEDDLLALIGQDKLSPWVYVGKELITLVEGYRRPRPEAADSSVGQLEPQSWTSLTTDAWDFGCPSLRQTAKLLYCDETTSHWLYSYFDDSEHDKAFITEITLTVPSEQLIKKALAGESEAEIWVDHDLLRQYRPFEVRYTRDMVFLRKDEVDLLKSGEMPTQKALNRRFQQEIPPNGRANALGLIKALAGMAELDISKHYKAAGSVQQYAELNGLPAPKQQKTWGDLLKEAANIS